MSPPSDRFARQAGLIPTEDLRETLATVIGVGAIGRQLALQLASLGVGRLQLIDPDKVDATNVTTQGYSEADIDCWKVEATAEAALRIDPKVRIETLVDRFRPAIEIGQVVFCCVDTIAARQSIWRSVKEQSQFWCDGRMRGEVLRVLTAAGHRGRERYAQSLFPQHQAQVGPCTARGVIYTAAIAAGLMVAQFALWRRGVTPEEQLSLNLLASELETDTD